MLVKELLFAYKFRRVWWFTATSRTKARFARTVLGSFWLGLTNLLTIVALGTVYGTVFSVSDPRQYFIYLGLGLVVWNTLASSIISAPQLFAHNASNIKNKSLPPLFYTLEEWAFQLQTFVQSFSLVFIVLAIIKPYIITNFILYSWLPLLNFIIFIYWFPLLICLIGAWYTDLCQLVPVVMQIIFLISPILYEKQNLEGLEWIINLNFIYKVLDPIRSSILEGFISYQDAMFLLFINFVGTFVSLRLLNRQRRSLPFLV